MLVKFKTNCCLPPGSPMRMALENMEVDLTEEQLAKIQKSAYEVVKKSEPKAKAKAKAKAKSKGE